jgi:soluble lytic murein transglycosylase-like protein
MQNNYHIIFYRILQYAIILIALTLRVSSAGSDTLYSAEINFFAAKYDLPPLLVRAVIRVESNFCQSAVNKGRKGHKGQNNGLMQVEGGSFEINENLEAGCSILRECLDVYEGNLLNGLTAYNAGIHGAKKYIAKKDYHFARKVLYWYWKYLWEDIIKNYELRIKNDRKDIKDNGIN